MSSEKSGIRTCHRLTQTLQFDDADINDEGHLILDLRTVRISLRSLSRIKAHERMRALKEREVV